MRLTGYALTDAGLRPVTTFEVDEDADTITNQKSFTSETEGCGTSAPPTQRRPGETAMTPRYVSIAKYTLMLLGILFGLYEAEHLLIPAAANAVPQTVAATHGQPQTVSFVIADAKKFPTGRVLLNNAKFPAQTETVCLDPNVGGPLDPASMIGKTVTVTVPLSTYTDKNGKPHPEYHVTDASQYSVK